MFRKSTLIISLAFLLTVYLSCTKEEKFLSPVQSSAQNIDPVTFFRPTGNELPLQLSILNKLKMQNEKANWINNLPMFCGKPLWNYMKFIKMPEEPSLAAGEDSIPLDHIIIPMSANGQNLSALLFCTQQKDGSYFNYCYTVNGNLYNDLHNGKLDTIEATQRFLLFAFLEKTIYGREKFEHLPKYLLAAAEGLEENSWYKKLEMKAIVPSTTISISVPVPGAGQVVMMYSCWGLEITVYNCNGIPGSTCITQLVDCWYVMLSGGGESPPTSTPPGSTGSDRNNPWSSPWSNIPTWPGGIPQGEPGGGPGTTTPEDECETNLKAEPIAWYSENFYPDQYPCTLSPWDPPLPDGPGEGQDSTDCNTSKEDLKLMFPNANDANMELLAFMINNYGKDFGINTKEKLRHFLAQTGHETGGFITLNVTENLNYSTASLLPKTYAKFTTDTLQEPTKKYAGYFIGNPQGLGNVAMCCKNGNGDSTSGDGWKYRGRGIMQLTWKNNYQSFKTWYNNKYNPDKDFVSNPDLVSTNDTFAIFSGLWYYKTRVIDKITIDSATLVKSITKKINGGDNGLTDRQKRFDSAKSKIDCR